jgi:hypothetical protein
LDMATETPLPTLPVTITDPSDREARERLRSRARRLTQLDLAWHALEAAIAIAAGVIAGSVALIGFGADGVIEAGAGLVVLWLVTCLARNPRRLKPGTCGVSGHDWAAVGS